LKPTGGLHELKDSHTVVLLWFCWFANAFFPLSSYPYHIAGFLATQCEKIGVQYVASRGPGYTHSTFRIRSLQEMDELDEQLKEYETRIVQMNSSQETLNRRFLELTELRHVLRETVRFFEEVSNAAESSLQSRANLSLLPMIAFRPDNRRRMILLHSFFFPLLGGDAHR
jgi:hypothetical protein